jgi:hypothetical protein
MTRSTVLTLPFLSAAVLLATALAASAGERPAALPGVEGAFSLVNPAPPTPEPEEFVEASPYGEGFVRIPGTETYLKISGMVRYDIDYVGENKKKK